MFPEPVLLQVKHTGNLRFERESCAKEIRDSAWRGGGGRGGVYCFRRRGFRLRMRGKQTLATRGRYLNIVSRAMIILSCSLQLASDNKVDSTKV